MKTLSFLFSAAVTCLMMIFGQGCQSESIDESTVTLSHVKIGSQVWMTKNLNIEHFRNGDPISEAKTKEEWVKSIESKTPSWCYYENEPSNGEIYGKLYNWYAVNDVRGLAPEGWHIPSDLEWTELTDFLGGENLAGGKMKSTGIQFWSSPNTNASNESGFLGLPGGFRSYTGNFYDIRIKGSWWSTTKYISNIIWKRSLHYDLSDITRNYVPIENGFSVRCIKN